MSATPQLTLRFYEFGIVRDQMLSNGVFTRTLVDPAHVADALSAKKKFSTGLIAPNVIYVAEAGVRRTLVEYRPRQKTAIFLEDSEEAVVVPFPELILIRTTTSGGSPEYHIFAVKERPTTLEIELFNAPFPNIFSDGRICWGSVQQVSGTALQQPHLAEDWKVLLGTKFNNHSTGHKSRHYPMDIRQRYFELEKRQARVWAKSDLVSARITLAKVLGEETA